MASSPIQPPSDQDTIASRATAGGAMNPADAVMAFVANAPISVVMTDTDLRFLKASPVWLENFGVDEAYIVGRSFYDLAPQFHDSFANLHRRCLAGETVSVPPERIVTRAGQPHWIARDAGPWRDADGAIAGLLIVIRDVTAERESEEEARLNRAFLSSILENVPMPMVVKDAEGRLLIMNRAMAQLYGDSYEGQLGKTVFDILPEDMAKQIAEEDRQALLSDEPLIEEVDATSERGRRFVRKIKASIKDDHGARFLLTITQDLTARKQSEEALERALAQAEAASVAKSEFLANMSHEIRTPLNGVLGLADALSRMELNAEQREIVEMIVSSGRALTGILSDVLDLAKAEAGQLELQEEPLSVRETIGATAFLFETTARQKGVGFKVTFDPDGCDRLIGDALRLRQIVSNLISNAVKFTTVGEVRIHAAAEARPDGDAELVVSVADTGPGFSEDVRARLFSRFEQGDGSVTRRFGGTGLGLSIANTLAQMMGGDISCTSAEGEGATFILRARLKVDAAPAVASHAPEATSIAADRGLRILLAEDHEINQRVIQLMLADVADLVITDDGEAAVRAFHEHGPFDLVLMDTQMPVMDGLTAMRRIRAEERRLGRPRTPIISLTANAMAHQVQSALEAGADAHLAKPITSEGLYAAINAALEPAPDEAAALTA